MKNIASALVKAQKAFGPALKTSTNPHFKSRYAVLQLGDKWLIAKPIGRIQ